MSHTKATALLVAVVLSSSVAAQDKDRLLPSEEAARISMTLRKDGGAWFVTVKNDSRLVLTEALLVCENYDSRKYAKFAPNGKEWCNGEPYMWPREGILGLPACEIRPDSTYKSIRDKILPGKSVEFYFEGLAPVRCQFDDLRGRAKKVFDF